MWRTAVDDATVVNVLDGLHDGAYQVGSVAGRGDGHQRPGRSSYRVGMDLRLVVVALGTYPVEELTARAQVEAQIEVMCRLVRAQTKLGFVNGWKSLPRSRHGG